MTSAETLNPPSAAAQNLPIHKTVDASSRAHYTDRSQHRDWNFLHGAGPSSSEMYYTEEKKGFKPGWKSMRQQPAIQQDKERLEQTAVKEQRSAACMEKKVERLNQWQTYNNYNPVTGTEKVDSSWKLASDPWQHLKQGIRPAATISSMATKADSQGKATAQGDIANMRKNRIANDGLFTTKRTGGSMADALNWQR